MNFKYIKGYHKYIVDTKGNVFNCEVIYKGEDKNEL